MKKPVLLNGKGRSKSLDLTIGRIRLELWDFEKTGERAFVRLSFISHEEQSRREDEDKGAPELYVDLDAMQADSLAIALGCWEKSLDSNAPQDSDPNMCLRIGAISIVAHGRHHERGALLELRLIHENNMPVTAKLTRVEADVLGTLLGSLIGEETADTA
jgi:hypothetical protein